MNKILEAGITHNGEWYFIKGTSLKKDCFVTLQIRKKTGEKVNIPGKYCSLKRITEGTL